MSQQRTPTNIGELDRLTLALYVGLVAIGWLMIYAVNYDPKNTLSFLSLSSGAGKQLFFIIICFALLFFILMSDWALWRIFAFFFYIGSVLLLIGPLFFGREVNGNNAWYQIGGFTFQPAEIAKFCTSLAMAGYLSSTGVNLRESRSRWIAFGILALPIFIIVLQKDFGTALIFLSFMLVLYREGLTNSWYVLGFGALALIILGLIFEPPYVVALLIMLLNGRLISRFRERQNIWWGILALTGVLTWWWEPAFTWFLTQSQIPVESVYPNLHLWVLLPHLLLLLITFLPSYLHKNNQIQGQLQIWAIVLLLGSTLVFTANFACYTVLAPHQQVRIRIWLRPNEITDTRGAAYNLLHSKMAIGAGGLFGKGFLEGNMTKLRYVPEQSTDYIFCTVGEEHGFIGTFSVIFMFAWLLYRLTILAERQRSNFSRIYIYCVTGVIFVHFISNIGMTMGLFPTIGIPLPFISSGGSSLIGFSLMMGVVLKLDSHRGQA